MDFDDLDKVSNNPARALNVLYKAIEAELDTDVVGTLNGKADPFTYMMDTIVGTHSIFLNRIADSLSIEYKKHARTIGDLSVHMSDEDWEGVFATPSTTTLRFTIAVEEIRLRALPFESLDGNLTNFYNKLIIPKDTIFKLPDADFWLGHAVEFRLMEHGGVQVVYDTTQTDPFVDLGTNYPERNIVELKGRQYISVLLPVRQIAIKEIPNKSSNDVVGFSYTDTFDDKLYRIRAFITPWGSTQRTEMTVVFNRVNYDPNYPTMTIDLNGNNQFTASIPSVYLQNGLGLGDVTILVYTTKGVYSRDLTQLTEYYHKASYLNYSNTKGTLNTYEQGIINVDDVHITSETPIVGGNDGMSFNDLKNTLIYGHRRRDQPISEIDLTQRFKELGYTTIKSLDYPNSRLYTVTKDLPIQDNKLYTTNDTVTINSTIGMYVGSVLISLDDIAALGIAKDNGARVTILPGSIIDVTKQTPLFYNQITTNSLLNGSMKDKVERLKNDTLVAIPYHYVLDTTNSQARIRAYYLEEPRIVNQSFFYENPYLGISLGVSKNGITISNDGTRYIIDIVTTSSDAYKNLPDESVGIQIGIGISEGINPRTARGTLVGKNSDGERLWRFIINTNFDIDAKDTIYFSGFNQYGELSDAVESELTETLNIIFTYQGDSTREKSVSDTRIDQSLFDGTQTSIVETEFIVQFGKRLENLYTAIRPMISSDRYLTYSENVPEIYTETEFQYENNELVIVDGAAVILHRAGDPMLTDAGKPIYKHRIGDIVYDSAGNPTVKEPRKILYYWDFLGFDYAYYLSQDEYDLEYRDKVKGYIANTIMDGLASVFKNKLERTEIMFKPKSTIGFTDVVLNEDINIQIKNDLRFTVTFYLSHEGNINNTLKTSLRAQTHRVINENRIQRTLSTSILINALNDTTQTDVKEVKVLIYSDDQQIDVISNVDDTNGFGIRKKLAITSDNFLTVKEDVEIIFKEHQARSAI